MLMLRQILGISRVALRWYNGLADGVRRVVWTFEIPKNFVVTSPSWESSVSHTLGCGVHAHT